LRGGHGLAKEEFGNHESDESDESGRGWRRIFDHGILGIHGREEGFGGWDAVLFRCVPWDFSGQFAPIEESHNNNHRMN
jgi:hypothetical protein